MGWERGFGFNFITAGQIRVCLSLIILVSCLFQVDFWFSRLGLCIPVFSEEKLKLGFVDNNSTIALKCTIDLFKKKKSERFPENVYYSGRIDIQQIHLVRFGRVFFQRKLF